MKIYRMGWLLVMVLGLSLSVVARAAEPANLGPQKDAIRAYVKSGEYDRDIAAVVARARAWLKERTVRRAAGERLTMIFDLDETLISNWPQIDTEAFGGSAASWTAWMSAGKDAAIEPVRELYRLARARQVDVVFITGRPERYREATEKNLRAIDCADYVALLCKPEDRTVTSATFKTAQRRRLSEEGRVIIANIGDQESDLSGGFAERTFKLPNPFYLSQ